jgi:hypothetical protein
VFRRALSRVERLVVNHVTCYICLSILRRDVDACSIDNKE